MFSPKSTCIGGWHPPMARRPPPHGKFWIRRWKLKYRYCSNRPTLVTYLLISVANYHNLYQVSPAELIGTRYILHSTKQLMKLYIAPHASGTKIQLSTRTRDLISLSYKARRPPPFRTQFFRFCIHFHWKVATLETKTPPKMGPRPPYGKFGIRPCLSSQN